MTTGFDRLRPTAAPRVIAFCATVLIAASPATAADDASRWDGDARSAIRLVAGSLPAGQTTPMRAGLEIRLKPGWHTYWRYPGDAGVPPRFDFAGSQNVKAVEVLWPAPQRIPEEGMVAIGYTGDVMLPLAIVPQDVSKPVLLHLKLDYAVCEKLCVPAEGKAELLLTGGPSSQDAALAAAAARSTAESRPRAGHRARHQIGAARGGRRAAAHHRRRRCATRHHSRPVRRGARAGLGAAGACADRRRAGRLATLRLRPRRRTARGEI